MWDRSLGCLPHTLRWARGPNLQPCSAQAGTQPLGRQPGLKIQLLSSRQFWSITLSRKLRNTRMWEANWTREYGHWNDTHGRGKGWSAVVSGHRNSLFLYCCSLLSVLFSTRVTESPLPACSRAAARFRAPVSPGSTDSPQRAQPGAPSLTPHTWEAAAGLCLPFGPRRSPALGQAGPHLARLRSLGLAL